MRSSCVMRWTTARGSLRGPTIRTCAALLEPLGDETFVGVDVDSLVAVGTCREPVRRPGWDDEDLSRSPDELLRVGAETDREGGRAATDDEGLGVGVSVQAGPDAGL